MCTILFKFGKDLNIDNWKLAKKLKLMKSVFSTNLNTFGSNMLLALKIMDSKNVTLTKFFIFM
jgi:hypothetical protein